MEDVKITEGLDYNGKPMLSFESPKFSKPFTICKMENGFAFYNIKSPSGSTAEALVGSFTSMRAAKKILLKYIDKAQESDSVKRNAFKKELDKKVK